MMIISTILYLCIVLIVIDIISTIINSCDSEKVKNQIIEKSNDISSVKIVRSGLNYISCFCPKCNSSNNASLNLDPKIKKITCKNCNHEFYSICN